MIIFLTMSLNPEKYVDLKIYQLDSLSHSSFQLNHIRVDPM
jgi:hypothetical protein